jgi:ribosomal protein L16 Arg81 hydroxylase
MNIQTEDDSQLFNPASAAADHAELDRWELMIKMVNGLSPELKQAWYELRFMPGNQKPKSMIEQKN